MNAQFSDLMEIKFRRAVVGSQLQGAAKTRFRGVKVALSKFPQRVFKRFTPEPGGFGQVSKPEQFIDLHVFFEPFEPKAAGKSSRNFIACAVAGLAGN